MFRTAEIVLVDYLYRFGVVLSWKRRAGPAATRLNYTPAAAPSRLASHYLHVILANNILLSFLFDGLLFIIYIILLSLVCNR